MATSGDRFAGDLGRDFHGVRVAWFDSLGGVPFDRACGPVVDSRRSAFESLGCLVEQAEPDFEGAEFAFKTIPRLAFGPAPWRAVSETSRLL